VHPGAIAGLTADLRSLDATMSGKAQALLQFFFL
jgi:hypothetical protein